MILNNPATFGEILQEYQEDMDNKSFAELLGVTVTELEYAKEKSTPMNDSFIQKICEVFGTSKQYWYNVIARQDI